MYVLARLLRAARARRSAGPPDVRAGVHAQRAAGRARFVAVACGLVGYFVVLRAQVFAGDALSHVAFTGALAAAAAGLDPRVGLFAATISVALVLGRPRRRAPAPTTSPSGSCSPGSWGSACCSSALFSCEHLRRQRGARRARPVRLDLRAQRRRRTARRGAIGGRRSRSPCWRSRGRCCSLASTRSWRAPGACPCKVLGVAFLVLLGATAAEATQAVGALLLLGLLAAPAGRRPAAHRQPVPRPRAVGAAGIAGDVGRARPQLLDPEPSPQQRHHRRGGRGLPAGVAAERTPLQTRPQASSGERRERGARPHRR